MINHERKKERKKEKKEGKNAFNLAHVTVFFNNK